MLPRRTVYLLLAIVVAIVAPEPDMITMVAFWLPAVGLYEVGRVVCRYYW